MRRLMMRPEVMSSEKLNLISAAHYLGKLPLSSWLIYFTEAEAFFGMSLMSIQNYFQSEHNVEIFCG